jgi:2'-5' RNA ligase
LRLFFALWPPPQAARALGEWARAVQRDTGGRVTADDTIHLTLAFLGEVDPASAAAAAARVRGRAFELPVDTARYWKHNQVVWAGPQEMPGELADMVGQLHGALRADGFVLEERPFAAHITLLRKAGKPATLAPPPPLAWPAREFTLVCSTASKSGSRYGILERFSLE